MPARGRLRQLGAMGVTGFWPRAAAYEEEIDLRDGGCRGEVWAVDSSVLLHACMAQPPNARSMVLRGVLAPPRAVGTYLRALAVLTEAGVVPIAVFDGAPRPDKAQEVADRQASREAARVRAVGLLESGGSDVEVGAAVAAAAHVSTELRVAAIGAAHQLGVRVVVAPFEADGQLVWLHLHEGATRVLTNDSDMGALGCSVSRVPPKAPLSALRDADVSEAGALGAADAGERPPRVLRVLRASCALAPRGELGVPIRCIYFTLCLT